MIRYVAWRLRRIVSGVIWQSVQNIIEVTWSFIGAIVSLMKHNTGRTDRIGPLPSRIAEFY